MKAYPVFLTGLERRNCVVVGGGAEAERKVKGLLECGARVTIIAPAITALLRRLVDRQRLDWIEREYRAGDLRRAFLVIVTEGDAQLRRTAAGEAEAENAVINSVDDVANSNFIAGSVVRRGLLAVAISTGGCAPALAVRLRQRLEEMLGPEHGLFLRWMQDLRSALLDRFPDFERRRKIWYQLVDSEILDLIRNGWIRRARERLEEIADPLAERRPSP